VKCYICDKTLKPDEISMHPQLNSFEPCFECLSIISEIFEDGLEKEEIDRQIEFEWGDSDDTEEKVLTNTS
jgi:hypothetical protein